jgi:G3E family GTPase
LIVSEPRGHPDGTEPAGNRWRSGLHGVRQSPEASVNNAGVPPHRTGNFSTLVFTSRIPIDRNALEQILHPPPAGVLRVKGVLHPAGLEGRYIMYHVQGTGTRVDLFPASRKPGAPAETVLLFVGLGFDTAAVKKRLTRCERKEETPDE